MHIKLLRLSIILIGLFWFDFALAQLPVTRIYTDYNYTTGQYDPLGTGVLWDSQVNTPAAQSPRNQHHLLGFVWNGITYSTGVDDAKLTNNGVSFIPTTFQALPVQNFIPSGSNVYIQLGERWDGVPNGLTGPYNTNVLPAPFTTPVGVTQVLTHGLQGLDLGSAVTNIPATSPLTFNFGAITDPSQIDDNIPDIMVTQMADAGASSLLDEIWFEDGLGNQVGNVLQISFASVPSLGNWYADFYLPNNGYVTASTWVNGARPMRLWAARASDFGLTAANFSAALVLKYHLKGSSDPAFIAYNTNFITLAAANNDSATTMVNQSIGINVLANDSPNNYPELSSFTLSSSTTNQGGTISHTNGTVVYTPPIDFVGFDTFTYQICINPEGNVSCDTATVTVMVYENNYTVCSGKSITLVAYAPIVGVYDYVWILPSGATVSGTSPNGTFSLPLTNANPSQMGVYNLEITNVNAITDFYSYNITLNLNQHCNMMTNPMVRIKVK